MSWLYSIVLAGLMFSSDTNLPVYTNNNFNEKNVKKVVRLDETERFEQTYPLNANGRVSVSNINGSITVATWDRNEVKLEATKIADSRERLTEVEIQIDARQDYFRVETDYDNWKNRDNRQWKNNGKLQVEFRLTVPRGAVLDEIETVNGSVTISNSTNITKASAVNGDVRASNLRGTASLSTVNGNLNADFDQLQSGSKINLDTVNGTVNLVIPSDANATVKADSLNGNITNDFGLPMRKGEYVGRDLYGRIGSGDVQIKLNSVNGALAIKRKNDGKNPNPAVNLLPQKAQDDEDFDVDIDNDNDSKIKADKIKINKEAKKAVKDAQKEINKIKPEIEKATSDALKEAAKVFESEEFKEKLKEAQLKQKDALLRISNADWSAPKIEKRSESFTVKGTPKVTVDAQNCAVSVRGWDNNEVKYFVTKISRNRDSAPVEFKAEQKDSNITIKVANETNADQDAFFPETTRVMVEVYVPKKSNLRIVTNREIRLENVSGEIDLSGAEEAINVRDSEGKLRVSTSDGSIRVIGFSGEIDSRTADGAMNLEGDFQRINAQTVDGSIILTLPEDANAYILSNQKDIETEGVSLVFVKDGSEVSTWKVGNGGDRSYRLFTTADGRVFVRDTAAMKSN